LKGLLGQLAKREISHLLIEGGGEVIASAFAAKVVDRVAWIIAPKILGGRDAPTSVDGIGISRLRQAIPLQGIQLNRLGSDLLVEGNVQFRRN
jgi:diaminohydroxyphosphoribosylaminopyrimidine deaminase/5-amino-6-(5-phosphoribosylamino)uracil reductase